MGDGSEDLFYHYTTRRGLLGILESKSIWATNIRYLNDSRELDHAMSLVRERIGSPTLGFGSDFSPQISNAVHLVLEIITSLHVFVACFSKQGDLLSQWRAYGSQTGGYSIGFSRDSLEAVAARTGGLFRQCVYDLTKQRQLIQQVIGGAEKKVQHLPKGTGSMEQATESLRTEMLYEFFQIAWMFKHPAFKAEEESRLGYFLAETDDNRLRFREGRSLMTPYIEIPLENEGALPIVEIKVGPTPNPDLAQDAARMVTARYKLQNCEITRSEVPYRAW